MKKLTHIFSMPEGACFNFLELNITRELNIHAKYLSDIVINDAL